MEHNNQIAAVDAKTLAVTAHYDLEGKGGQCAGLDVDVKNRILFAAFPSPQNMVILKADRGSIITALPIAQGADGAAFNPKTMEAFRSQGDGILTIVKENSPSDFVVGQTSEEMTMTAGKTLTLDAKTNRILIIAAEYTPPRRSNGTQARADGSGFVLDCGGGEVTPGQGSEAVTGSERLLSLPSKSMAEI